LATEEIKGLIYSDDLSSVLRKFREGLLRKKTPNQFDFRMIKKNGKICWVETFCSLITYAGETAVQVLFVDITERKKAEEALKESEEQFRNLSEESPNMIFINKQGRVVYANKKCEEIMGYTKEVFYSPTFNFFSLIAPDSVKTLRSNYNKHKSGEEVAPYEYALVTKTGERINAVITTKLIKYNGASAILGIITDITERKKMETTLREAEKRYHALFDKAPLGILVVDETATAVEFNEEAHRQLGYTREEFAKLKVYDYEVNETPKETRARMKKVMREGKDEFETQHRTKNGEIRDVVITVQLIELAGKKFFHLITRDITEQKKIERELKIEKDKLDAVTENIGAGLGIISKDYRILWANKLLKEVHGECEGKKCFATFNRLTGVCPDCGVKKIFTGGVPIDIHEYSNVDDKGDRYWIELIVTPIKDEKGNIIAALELAVNITERKIMQNKLAEYSQKLEKLVNTRTNQLKLAQAKLVKSERLAVIGELAAMVGHDLRNPLTGIMGAAYYLKTKHTPELGAKAKEMLETIENAIIYSNKIVNDLLEYSRDLKLELAETTPKELLKTALSLIDVPKGIHVIDATEDNSTVKIDAEKMRRVFVNIIRNAFDAMTEGGTLTIKSRKAKDKLEFSFKDTGVGMSKETLSKLKGGVPLFTTKAKGMGFGVPICKRIAEAHGGKLSVESNVGKGTAITITVPVNPPPTNENEVKLIFNESMLQTITAKQKAKQK
jgi:PAS domain S-box-containing protein